MGLIMSYFFRKPKDTEIEDYYLHAWEIDDMKRLDLAYVKNRHPSQEPFDFRRVTPSIKIPTYR
jgi:hypothetical protein